MNPTQLHEMHQMLSMCLSDNNEARAAAEAQITKHLNEHREVFIFGLTKLIRESQAIPVRVLCAVILRQVLPQGDTVLFLKLPEDLQKGIQNELLAAITHEPDRYVRTQISDTIATLACVLIYQDRWPGLFEALYSMCQPQVADGLKICALMILGKLDEAADNLQPQAGQLHAVFQSTINKATSSLLVRVETVVACCRIIGIIEEKAHIKEYQKFIPLFLETLADCITAKDEDLAKRVLSSLCEVATEDGKYFEPYINNVIPIMHAIGADTQKMGLDDGLRQYAMEVMVATAEHSPTMIRKNPSYIRHSLLVALSLMLDVEDDPNWSVSQDDSDFYDESNFDCGEHSIDRLCLSVKGTKLWPHLSQLCQTYLTNKDDWKYRHAALCALAQSTGVLLLEQIPIKEISVFINDPHPRVRWACIQVLGQIPIEFERTSQQKWHKIMFPVLMQPLGDFQHPRLQAHASSALLNVVDGCPGKIVKLYLAPLMNAMMSLLKQSHLMVQDRVMPVMACIAGQTPKAFLPYYDHVVPLMISILEHARTKETRMLRARAMESVSFIGMYVGKERFHNDAKKIVEIFLTIMHESAAKEAVQGKKPKVHSTTKATTVGEDDDYSEQHMMAAWTRICAALGAEFVPILPYIMPRALEVIARRTENELRGFNPQGHVRKLVGPNGEDLPLDGDGDGEEEDPNVSKNGMVKGITTAAALSLRDAGAGDRPTTMAYNSYAQTAAQQEKGQAMEMVISFLHDLREHFITYVKDTATIFIPLLTSYVDDIRTHAIEAMPHLMKSTVEAFKKNLVDMPFTKGLFQSICTQMLASFDLENYPEVLASVIIAMEDLISEAGVLAKEVIDANMLETIGRAMFSLLTASHKRIADREELLKEEEKEGDLDEERILEIESRNEAEDQLHSQVANLMQSLIKSHGEYFIPTFDKLLPEVLRMLSINSTDSTKKIAVFILDDMFEFLGPAAVKYYKDTLECMCIYATQLNGEHGLRQASAWGIHMAAKHGGVGFQPFLPEIATRFAAAIQADPTYLQREAHDEVGQEFIPQHANDEGEPEDADDEDGTPEEATEETGEEETAEIDDDEADERSRFAALDNLVSAFGAMAFYQGRPDLYPVWLNYLPLREDASEGENCYSLLLDLIDANNPAILGENFANLPKLLTIFLCLVGTTFLKKKTLRERVGKFFANIKAMPPALLQQVVPHLPQKLQVKLQSVLATV